MSIHCINMPPKIVPWVLVSPGNTSCSVSPRDVRGVRRDLGAARFGIAKRVSPPGGGVKPDQSLRAAGAVCDCCFFSSPYPALCAGGANPDRVCAPRSRGPRRGSCIVPAMIGRTCVVRHLPVAVPSVSRHRRRAAVRLGEEDDAAAAARDGARQPGAAGERRRGFGVAGAGDGGEAELAAAGRPAVDPGAVAQHPVHSQ